LTQATAVSVPCCKNGHEYTDANTYIEPKTGKRQCKECRAIRRRASYRRAADRREKCKIPGCGHPQKPQSRGWCGSHYERWRVHGDPLAGEPIRPAKYGPAERAERQRDAARRYRESHHEQELARYRAYRQENWERVKASLYRWRRENSGNWHAIVYTARLRRLQRIGPDAEHVDREAILAEFGMVCHICGAKIGSRADLEFDHVIPIALGGQESYDNIRPSHMRCNRRKGAKLLSVILEVNRLPA
jgi:5-methylcytosine-specific restriction endonuclease McrA